MDTFVLILLTGSIIFCTFTVEGISGFGSTVLALPFISILLGLEKAVPLLAALSLFSAAFILSGTWRKINWSEYGFIVSNVIPGAAAGVFLMNILPKLWMQGLLAGLIFFASIKGILELRHKQMVQPESVHRSWRARLLLAGGGIFQGAFSSGGPVITLYAARALPEKSSFRATLLTLWLTVNSVMLLKFSWFDHVWTSDLLKLLVCTLPFQFFGFSIGAQGST